MLHTFLKAIAGIIAVPLVGILNFAGYNIGQVPPPVHIPIAVSQNQSFGATNIIDTPIALFSTSLAAPITAAATAMTLVSGATDPSTTLASSTYSFIIDEGQSDQEFVRADCTNTTCTNMARGLSMVDGSTTIASLAQPHRRGQSVKITDAPLLLVLTNLLNGNNEFPTVLKYHSIATTTVAANRNNIASVGLVQDLAFNGAGVINATNNASGVTQIATGLQAASSTGLGSSGASLVIPSAISTSTYNTLTAPLKVVVTQNNGKIDPNFISTSTLYAYTLPVAGSSIASTTIYNDGSNNLAWGLATHLLTASSTSININNTTASTTIYSATIPANNLGTANLVRVRIYILPTTGAVTLQAGESLYLEAGYGSGSTTVQVINNFATMNPGPSDGYIDFLLQANGATNSQNSLLSIFATNDAASTTVNYFVRGSKKNTLTTDSTASQQLTIVGRISNNSNQLLTSGLSTTELIGH